MVLYGLSQQMHAIKPHRSLVSIEGSRVAISVSMLQLMLSE